MGAPIGNTCPDIDEAMRTIESVIETLDYIYKNIDTDEYDDDLRGAMGDLENVGSGRSCTLEELRASNSMLRDYGEGMEAERDELEEKVVELERELESMPIE